MTQRTVTIKDIAAVCKVGVTTVSRALNNQPGISRATRNRVLKVAKTLNYSPNLHAQELRAQKTNQVAVLMKGPTNPFFLEMIDSLERELRASGYSMAIVRVKHLEDEVSAALDLCCNTRVAGVIFMGGTIDYRSAELARLGVPCVRCTVPMIADDDRDYYSSVAVDDKAGIEALVSYLYGEGHRQIAFLGSDSSDASVGFLRLQQFLQATKQLSLDLDPDLLVTGDNSLPTYSFEYSYHLTRQLLNRNKPFTALVTMTDVLAIGAQRALHSAGLDVPKDVSVVGFDGLTLGKYVTPSLTTYVQPIEDIIKHTWSLLRIGMEGGHRTSHLLVPGTLRLGESSAKVLA